MPQSIQIKRGNKNNLPKLNIGEPAFSLDTKEVWMGNMNHNQLIQTRENLIVNGNFQVVGENFEAASETITILPGTSRFIYGNFYLSNASSSKGNITISRPNNGFITIESMNAQISFEYRERLSEYLALPLQTYTTIRPLFNQTVTLSFDYKNTGNALNFSSGSMVPSINTISIPSGSGNTCNTFSMKYTTSGNSTFTKIILLSSSENNTYAFSIGNIKLEVGNDRTPFIPNPLYADILAIEQVYKQYNVVLRCLNENIGDLFNFYYPVSFPICFKTTNASVKVVANTLDIYSYDGIKQTGFSVTTSYYPDYNNVIIQAKKTNNRLKEVYLIANFIVDLRPY